MRDHLAFASLYAHAYAHRASAAAHQIPQKVAEHKSELTCIAATSVVVGLAARVAGFKAGYAFAKTPNLVTTVTQ